MNEASANLQTTILSLVLILLSCTASAETACEKFKPFVGNEQLIEQIDACRVIMGAEPFPFFHSSEYEYCDKKSTG